MNLMLENSPDNRALASAVNSRIAADARIINAKAAMWRLLGVSALAGMIGVGAGAAFYGYSYVTDTTTAANKVAEAIKSALEKTEITLNGEVGLKPDQTVAVDGGKLQIDPSSRVALDTNGATVRLDPNARVTVDGNFNYSRPTDEQLRGGGSGIATPANTVVNFTIFRTVPYGDGRVTTGWKFSSSDDRTPHHQYCYYGMPTPESGIEITMDLAKNGEYKPATGSTSGNVDTFAASQLCQWYGGGSTRRADISPDQTIQPTIQPPATSRPDTVQQRMGRVMPGVRPPPNVIVADWCGQSYPSSLQQWCINTFSRNGRSRTF